MKTRQLAMDAVLAAMCAVLGFLAIDMNVIKVTLESFPILLGALLFGPVDGLAIGFVGTFLYQILRYGISATTLLWILPYCVCGLLVGLYAKKHDFHLNRRQVLVIVIVAEVLVTLINTGVIYLDSKIYGYYFPGIVTGALAVRSVVCVVKAVIFGAVLPTVVDSVRKFAWRSRQTI